MTTETAPAGPQAVTGKEYQLLINGQEVAPRSGEMMERRYPANNDVIVAKFPKASEEDVDAAIQAAREAFDKGGWSKAPARQRATVLRKAADKIREEMSELSRLLASEVGKPVSEAGMEVALTADVFDYYAGMAINVKGQVVSNYTDDAIGMILKEPVGVVGIITPWNFPMLLATWKIAPALAVGCTTVIKPASYTPCTTYELGRILTESGAPAGVVNVVTGSGKTVGDRIAASPLVDKVAFTGSTEVGQQVMRAAASNVKKISLELGGKSPNVVFADSNLQGAVIGALFGIYMNAGQVCQAGSRLLVEESVHDQFLNMFSNFVAGVKVGDPMDPATRMGPVVSDSQLDTVESYVKAGNDEKATLVARRQAADGRGLRQGLLLRADDLRPGGQPDEDRAGGDLRAGAFGDPVQGRGRGAADRERHDVRARRGGVDEGHRQGVQVREGDQGGDGLDQQLPRGGDARRAAHALRRVQAVGHRAGAGAGGAGGVHGDEVGQLEAELGARS